VADVHHPLNNNRNRLSRCADRNVGSKRSISWGHDAGSLWRSPVWQAGVHTDALLGHEVHQDRAWSLLLSRLELRLRLLVLSNAVDVCIEQVCRCVSCSDPTMSTLLQSRNRNLQEESNGPPFASGWNCAEKIGRDLWIIPSFESLW
jgi:hypothetical protein